MPGLRPSFGGGARTPFPNSGWPTYIAWPKLEKPKDPLRLLWFAFVPFLKINVDQRYIINNKQFNLKSKKGICFGCIVLHTYNRSHLKQKNTWFTPASQGWREKSKASLRLRLFCMMKHMHQYKQKRWKYTPASHRGGEEKNYLVYLVSRLSQLQRRQRGESLGTRLHQALFVFFCAVFPGCL